MRACETRNRSVHELHSPQGMKTPTALLRVQEPFTAEPAEGAENTRWLSGLGVR